MMPIQYSGFFWQLFAGLLLSALCQSGLAQDTQAAGRGQAVFTKHMCFSCHGTHGQGGERNAGPRIAPNPFPFVAFERQLRQPRASMPRYPVQFISSSELNDLYAYVQSIPAAPAAKDIALLRDALR
jgi:mono/diheme cytochrome c family protein